MSTVSVNVGLQTNSKHVEIFPLQSFWNGGPTTLYEPNRKARSRTLKSPLQQHLGHRQCPGLIKLNVIRSQLPDFLLIEICCHKSLKGVCILFRQSSDSHTPITMHNQGEITVFFGSSLQPTV